MLSDDVARTLESAVDDCDTARAALDDALDAVAANGSTEKRLRSVAAALEDWRDAQHRFMDAVDAADVDGVATAAMLLKMNRGVDATNARRGLPGVAVEGADQPFDLDRAGDRGQALTEAAMHYVTPRDEE